MILKPTAPSARPSLCRLKTGYSAIAILADAKNATSPKSAPAATWL